MDSYKGDTYCKKLARAWIWSRIDRAILDFSSLWTNERLGRLRQEEAFVRRGFAIDQLIRSGSDIGADGHVLVDGVRRHLLAAERVIDVTAEDAGFPLRDYVVLASEWGGDVGCLLTNGVTTMDQITAVDLRIEAVEACRARWPSLNVIHGDARTLVTDRTAAVFLDFCGNLNTGTLAAASDVWAALPIGAVCGIAWMKGREKYDVTWRTNSASRNIRRRAARGADAALLRGDSTTAEELIRDRFASVRAALLRASPDPSVVTTKAVAEYRGQRNRMMVGVFQKWTLPRVWRLSHLKREAPPPERAQAFACLDEAAAKQVVRRRCLIDYGDAPMANPWGVRLNVPAATIAAWKAHATRAKRDRPTLSAETVADLRDKFTAAEDAKAAARAARVKLRDARVRQVGILGQ